MKRIPITSIAALALVSGSLSLQAGFLLNPSFEANYPETWPHYGSVDEWTGGSGTNKEDGPFHNNGTPVPDGAQMAFMQGGKIGQDISGLVVGKKYWVQFYYDARACCGGTIDLGVFIDDDQIDNITNVKPVANGDPYNFRSATFTAKATTANLLFQTTNQGDATILLDAVTVVQRDDGNAQVKNPSFEASGDVPDGGVVTALAGWDITGTVGISKGEADNGKVPDQDHVAYLKGPGSVSQKVVGLLKTKPYKLIVGYNAGKGTKPHIQVKVGTKVVFEEDVDPVGGTAAYKSKTIDFTAEDVTAVISIGQSKAGSDLLMIDNIQLLGETGNELDPISVSPTALELASGQDQEVTVKIPAEPLADKAVSIVVGTSNANILVLPDASGALQRRATLTFAKGGSNEQKVKVRGLAKGQAVFQILDGAGLKIGNQPGVVTVEALIKNPSFESTPVPGGVGYGAIAGWTGGSGLNTSAGPFADNGTIPDRGQIGFIQGAAKLSQEVNGLTVGKNYWLQFFYNVRNCCGDGFAMDVSVKLGGKELSNIKGIKPSDPYAFHHVEFVAESASGTLEFSTTPTADSTLLLDGVTIVQRDKGQIVIANPSFEASGSVFPFPGYFPSIAGWEVAGGGRGTNIDGIGPFTDNGRAGDQDLVLFMQGNGSSVTQTLRGLTKGTKYVVGFLLNGRLCCGAEENEYEVTVDETKLLGEPFLPVGAANPYYVKQGSFTANAAEAVLTIKGTTPAGDHTILVDNVVVIPESFKPVILSQPRTVSAAAGESASLTVGAVGAGLSYQWFRNGVAIAGQTKETLSLASVAEAQGGEYTVEVKNAGGSSLSTAAKLNVLVSIPGVFDTGVGNDKKLLAEAEVDPHYVLVTNPDDAASKKAFILGGLPGAWAPNSDVSQWIGPRESANGHAAGDYVYRLSLDLTNYDPATVTMTGGMTFDNSLRIEVNGAFYSAPVGGFNAITEGVTIGGVGVFKAGMNQVDFVVINGGPDANPSGLRVEGLTAVGAKTGGGGVVDPTPTAKPSLAIGRLGSQARLAWPTAAAAGYSLESSTDLKTWTPAGLATSAEGTNTTAVAPVAGARFFRLKK